MRSRSWSVTAVNLPLLASAMLLATTASAQQSQYVLPVERGILESHLDLQYQYASAGDLNTSILSIEGQLVLAEIIEVGVNVPFLVNDNATFGSLGEDGAGFGDVALGAKVRLFGVGDNLGLSAYVNGWLPTHSGDMPRDSVTLQGGGAVEATLLGFKVGGNVQIISWIREGDNPVLLGFNGFGRLPIFPLLAIQAAIEYFNSINPNGDVNALLITPGIEASISAIHVGLSARIATTDEAKSLIGGRVAVLANAGLRF